MALLLKPRALAARLYSSARAAPAVWELFPAARATAEREAPRYVMSMRENLEFVLEQMRRVERQAAPPVLELLNRNARRPKKANHGKRPCSHHRRRQRRLGRRSDD